MATSTINSASAVTTGALSTAPTHLALVGNFNGCTITVLGRYSDNGFTSGNQNFGALMGPNGAPLAFTGPTHMALDVADNVVLRFVPIGTADNLAGMNVVAEYV